ncbi:MAG: sugar transferase [Anaerolineales bacterium]|nr:sugar transferase [Anaerolineales bacterium]
MLKRIFDFLSALIGLIITGPFLLVVAFLIKIDSPGPVFYRAERVGQDGKLIYLFKFRSMKENAAGKGPGITVAGDSRITRFGRFLRKSKIDELPQLINVLIGEMSLVGPRPEDPRYVARYTDEQRRVLKVRPGITSPASVHYRNEEQLLDGPAWEEKYLNQVLPHKLQIELDYLTRRTFFSDLLVLISTLLPVVSIRERS